MRQWLKIFGLSFFSDKTAAEAVKRGFAGIFLALLLSFVFFLFGYYGADVAPFSARYDGAASYKEFIDGAFGEGGAEFVIEDKKAKSEKIINTYTDESGLAKNGYNLIIDTRAADTLIEFTQVAVKDESEISYEDYLALSGKDRDSYKLETRYTGNALVITDGEIAGYEQFLKSEESAKEEYEALDAGAEDYGEQLYYLYVKYYYTSVSSLVPGAKAPVLRDYYYRQYIANGNAYYLYVFDNMLAGSFETDGGVPVVFGGYFSKIADGGIEDIHAFIKDVYYGSVGYTFTSYFVSAVSQLPMLIFIPLIIALIMWGIGKAVKDGWEKSYGGCLKIVYSFLWVAALITSLLTFAFGWVTSAATMYALMPVILAALLIVRTAIFCILSTVRNRKIPADGAQSNINDIFGGNL